MARKTTLLLIVAGIVRPAGGMVRVEGGDPDDRLEVSLSLLGHRAAIKARMSVSENLRFWAALNGGSSDIDGALQRVGLGSIARLDAGYLSAGQTRRLALARLLLADRPIWLLDEPTAALDAPGEALVTALIDEHLDRGGLVLAATHHDLHLSHTSRTLALGATVVQPEAVW